jgi:hypothetical protein
MKTQISQIIAAFFWGDGSMASDPTIAGRLVVSNGGVVLTLSEP